MPIRVGINGLGRIGRAVLRIILGRGDMEVVAVNDINPDIHNMAYLVKYDSTYGRLEKSVHVEDDHIVIGNEKRMKAYHQNTIDSVLWNRSGVDIVVDASGVRNNLLCAHKLKGQGVHCYIVTSSPPENEIDKTIVIGTNHGSYDPRKDFIIASSICDSIAFVPVVDILERNFGIEHGFVTTLHPWLNYQNVLDGPSISYALPGEIYDNYALGRGSTGSLIPKNTSVITASCKVLKNLTGKFLSMSYRVPTKIVTSADICVKLKKTVDIGTIKAMFEGQEKNQAWKIFYNNKEALVSTDFAGFEYSAVIDHRWIMKNEDNFIKMVLWYDNEWGYSSRVVDLIDYIGRQKNG